MLTPRRRPRVDRAHLSTPVADSSPTVVQTDGGPVTLCDLAVLKGDADRLDAQANDLRDKAASLNSLAHQKWIECGRAVLTAYSNAIPPEPLRPLIEAAMPLQRDADAESAVVQAIHDAPHHGLGRVVARATTWNAEHKASSQLAATNARLEPMLVEIAHQAADFPTSETAAIHAQAVAAEKEASDLAVELNRVSSAAASTYNALHRREQSVAEMGFDALYATAYLHSYGTPNVESPLVLKRGEHAALSVLATLARQRTRTQYVGGSSGFSFPIGHTGIRYRVGSYHGHPVEQQYLAQMDAGTLVVTDQRIAFVGQAKSSATALEKVLHIECYKDAIAIFREGRENADFYLVAQPQYVLFIVNWVLSQNR